MSGVPLNEKAPEVAVSGTPANDYLIAASVAARSFDPDMGSRHMNYWTVYWFQGIACFVFSSTATFSGITGSAISGSGAFVEGLISAGTGEVTGAVADPPVLVSGSGGRGEFARFGRRSGLQRGHHASRAVLSARGHVGDTLERNRLGCAGDALGAYVGSRLQGRFGEEATRRFFVGVFVVISLTFLAFTFFGENS